MRISFPAHQLKGAVHLPSSKSLSNRALMIKAYAGVPVDLQNLSAANDTVLLQCLLEQIAKDPHSRIVDVEDAGTAFRFLLSYLSVQDGREFILNGTKRLQQRPISDLVDALRSLGASIEYLEEDGFAPLLIRGNKLQGGVVQISAGVSSQFVSSLCLLAPVLPLGMEIKMTGQVVSDTYIQMTLALMQQFGIASEWTDNRILIRPQVYQSATYTVENDWSSACFFYAMAMLDKETELFFPNLSLNSMQGDAYIARLSEDLGIQTKAVEGGLCLHNGHNRKAAAHTTYNLSGHPDLAVPVIVAFALAHRDLRIAGIQHLEYKESRRLTVLQQELGKLGIQLPVKDDTLSFTSVASGNTSPVINVNVHDDHRIAMALTLPALMGITMVPDNPQCVMKSFPGFYTEISTLGFAITEA